MKAMTRINYGSQPAAPNPAGLIGYPRRADCGYCGGCT